MQALKFSGHILTPYNLDKQHPELHGRLQEGARSSTTSEFATAWKFDEDQVDLQASLDADLTRAGVSHFSTPQEGGPVFAEIMMQNFKDLLAIFSR